MLTVITGPMFAGKTSALISQCTSHIIAHNTVVAFKPAKDNRYDDKFIVSHNLDKFSCIVVQNVGDMLKYLTAELNTPDVVAIDEAQFFDPNSLVDFIDKVQKTIVKRIICAGLSQDARGYPFGAMPELLSIADEIIHLKAVCSSCHGIGIATRTYMKDRSRINEQVVVGGKDIYEARCFRCWK